jgi:DNA polymerase III gamma/tau subunit
MISYLDLPLDIKERLINQAADINLKSLLNIFDIILKYQDRAKHCDFPQIILEMMVIRLTSDIKENPNPNASVQIKTNTTEEPTPQEEPRHKPQNSDIYNSANADPAPESIQTTKEEDAEVKPCIKLETIKEKWDAILEEISKVKMSASTYLKEAVLLGIEKNILRLWFSKKLSFHKETLEQKDNQSALEGALKKCLDTNLKIKFETTAEEYEENNPELKQHHKEKDASIIRSALDVFKGRLVD